MTAFLHMGGYAAFVWPSLGLTGAIMAGLLVATLRQLRARQRRLAELEAAGTQRRRRGAPISADRSPAASANAPGGTRKARP